MPEYCTKDLVGAVVGKFWVSLSSTGRQVKIELRHGLIAPGTIEPRHEPIPPGSMWRGVWLTKAEAEMLCRVVLPKLIDQMRDEESGPDGTKQA